jgi:hypothetical protein
MLRTYCRQKSYGLAYMALKARYLQKPADARLRGRGIGSRRHHACGIVPELNLGGQLLGYLR